MSDSIFDAAISELTERTIDRLRADIAKLETAHGQNMREIDRLRAELAAKDRTLGENIRQTLLEQKRSEAAEAERDAMRALLLEAYPHIWPGDRALADNLRARIYAALKGGGDE